MFNIGEFIESLRTLVPDLSEEQVAQISSILSLAFGSPAEEPPAEMPGATPEIMAWFGLGDDVDPYRAIANIEEVLAAIQKIVPLEEEQLDKVSAILQLSLASAAADEEGSEDMAPEDGEELAMDDEDYEDEDMGEEDEELMAFDEDEEGLEDEEDEDEYMAYDEEDEDEEDELRAIIDEALTEVLGTRSTRRPTGRGGIRSFSGIPPYSFTRKDDAETGGRNVRDPRRAAVLLRYGEDEPAIKAVMVELYGRNYARKRFDQAQAFGRYIRWGAAGLGNSRALKKVILAPSQIKAFLGSGMSVGSLKTDMSDVIDQLGGVMVPEDFRLDMIERLPGNTVVRRYAEVLSTGSDIMTRVKVTGGNSRYTGNVRVTWVGDVPASGGADTNPTFSLSRAPIHITKATVHIPMSLLEDTPFPLVQKINEWVSEAYGINEDEQFLIGNGIAKPYGLLPNSANGNSLAEGISGSDSTITADGLKTLKYAVKRQYRQNAIWVMSDQTAMTCAKLKDGEGRYLWEDSMQVGEPDKLLGAPVETSEAMPSIAQNAYPILYGDMKHAYQIADRIGMSVTRDDITKAEEDIVKFIFRRRLGGQVRLEVAMAAQKVSAT